MGSERSILESLDHAVREPRAAAFLSALVDDVAAGLGRDSAARLAWRTVPLDVYASLPEGIASSWVFVLRAGCSSGAERHPNSIQRVMSYRGWADMRTWNGKRWVSHHLHCDRDEKLESRWLSIPANMWHRPVMDTVDWAVVSFHTASDAALIEELALDDDRPDRGSRAAELYAGRQAR